MALFVAGQTLEAADLNVLQAAAEPWTDYVPVWTCSGTAPALGNGTLTGKYRRVGKTIDVQVHFLAGTTTTFGTNSWFFSLPVAAAIQDQVGTVRLLDLGVANKAASCFLSSTTTITPITSTADVSSTVPHTWATGDRVDILMMYETA